MDEKKRRLEEPIRVTLDGRRDDSSQKCIDDPLSHYGMFCDYSNCWKTWRGENPVYNRDFICQPSGHLVDGLCAFQVWTNCNSDKTLKLDDVLYTLPPDHWITYAFFQDEEDMFRYLGSVCCGGCSFKVRCMHLTTCDIKTCKIKYTPENSDPNDRSDR